MTNQEQAINDGDFYLSRCRVNRHVLSIVAGDTATLRLNGKISKVIIDATNSGYAVGSGNIGQFQLLMDVEDGDGAELPYCDQITGLNFSGSGSNQVISLEASQGANQGTASSKSGMHFSVSAPSTASSGGGTLNEPAAWNGLVCGLVRFQLTAEEPNILDPTKSFRVVILLE